MPAPPPPPRARPGLGVLLAVSGWRLAIVASALTGFLLATDRGLPGSWQALSQLASLGTALVYAALLCYPALVGLRRHEPRSPWLRGATAVVLLLVGGAYFGLLGGDVGETWSLLEHLVTPLLVLVDYLVVGRNQAAARWWHPLTWLLPPLAYLAFYVAVDLDAYAFLDPTGSAFVPTLAGLLVGVLVLGYLLVGYGALRRLAGPPDGVGPVAPELGVGSGAGSGVPPGVMRG